MSQAAFQLAGGSVIGRDHRLVPKNCQDGWYAASDGVSTVGIVTDGCSSSPHSEVGAKLGARLLCENIQREARPGVAIDWQQVRQHTLADMDVLARQMGGDYRRVIEDYFLFTTVGVLLTDAAATFFALGDGVVIVNGQTHVLGPFPDNTPPYLGYGLVEGLWDADLSNRQFEVVEELDISGLEHFVIGCDGVADLIKAAEKCQSGSDQPVGGIEQFWQEDKYFRNPELVNRRLKLIARDWPRHDPQPGLLPDDTTLIVGRRILSEPPEEA